MGAFIHIWVHYDNKQQINKLIHIWKHYDQT